MENDWIEAENISISLKDDVVYISEPLKRDILKDGAVHYDNSSLCDKNKTYYKITDGGVFVKFLVEEFEEQETDHYGFHFIPHNNITFFEALKID